MVRNDWVEIAGMEEQARKERMLKSNMDLLYKVNDAYRRRDVVEIAKLLTENAELGHLQVVPVIPKPRSALIPPQPLYIEVKFTVYCMEKYDA